MVWIGIEIHTIHLEVNKEVRKIFVVMNIYKVVTYCYNKNHCLLANLFVYYNMNKRSDK